MATAAEELQAQLDEAESLRRMREALSPPPAEKKEQSQISDLARQVPSTTAAATLTAPPQKLDPKASLKHMRKSIAASDNERDKSLTRMQRSVSRMKDDAELAARSEEAGRARSLLGAFTGGVGSTFAGIPEGLESLVTSPFEAAFGDLDTPPEDRPGRRLGEWIRRGFQGPVNPNYAEDFTTHLAQGAGSLVAFFAGGIAGRAAGLARGAAVAKGAGLAPAASAALISKYGVNAGRTAAGIIGTMTVGSEAIQDAERNQAEAGDRFTAFLGGMALGATEMLTMGAVLNRLDHGSGGFVDKWIQDSFAANVFVQGTSGAIEEGIQEFIQNAGTNAIAKALYDADRAIIDAGVIEGTEIGGILGFTMSALVTALGGRAARRSVGGLDMPPAPGPAARAEAAAGGEAPSPPGAGGVERPKAEAVSLDALSGAESVPDAPLTDEQQTQLDLEAEAAAATEPEGPAVLTQRRDTLRADIERVTDPTAKAVLKTELRRLETEIAGGKPTTRTLKERQLLASTPMTDDTADIVIRKLGGLDTSEGEATDFAGRFQGTPLEGRLNVHGIPVSNIDKPGSGTSLDHVTEIFQELGFIAEKDIALTRAILDRIANGEVVRNPRSPALEAELEAEAGQREFDLGELAHAQGETGEPQSIQQLTERLAELDEGLAESISTRNLPDNQAAAVLQDNINRLEGEQGVEPRTATETGDEPIGVAETERQPVGTQPAADTTGTEPGQLEPAAGQEPGTGEPAAGEAPAEGAITAPDGAVQQNVVPTIGDESRRVRPRNQLWNEAAAQMDPANAVAVDDAQVGDTVLESKTRYAEIDPFSDYGVVIATDDRTGAILVESPQDTYRLRPKKREKKDPNAGVNWIGLFKGRPTAWGLEGANPAINDASSVTREQVLKRWRETQDNFADTLQKDEADAQAIRDAQEEVGSEVGGEDIQQPGGRTVGEAETGREGLEPRPTAAKPTAEEEAGLTELDKVVTDDDGKSVTARGQIRTSVTTADADSVDSINQGDSPADRIKEINATLETEGFTEIPFGKSTIHVHPGRKITAFGRSQGKDASVLVQYGEASEEQIREATEKANDQKAEETAGEAQGKPSPDTAKQDAAQTIKEGPFEVTETEGGGMSTDHAFIMGMSEVLEEIANGNTDLTAAESDWYSVAISEDADGKAIVELWKDEGISEILVETQPIILYDEIADKFAELSRIASDAHFGIADVEVMGPPTIIEDRPTDQNFPKIKNKRILAEAKKDQDKEDSDASAWSMKTSAGFEFGTVADARRQLVEMQDAAAKIGQTEDNSKKVILSLFDSTGTWSQPFVDAGYTVIRMDASRGDDIMQQNWLALKEDIQERGLTVDGILAACPCTSYSNAGARWWSQQHDKVSREWVQKKYGDFAARYFDTPLDYANTLVSQVQLAVEKLNPRFYALENPSGRMRPKAKLPLPALSFDPWHFGDPYTKRTHLWGEFNNNLQISPIVPLEGSKMHKMGSGQERVGGERSATPEGFAYAFFSANHQTGAIVEPTDQETPDGVQAPVPTGDAGTRTEDVQGTAAVGQDGRPPTGQEPGGPPDAQRPDGGRAEVPERGDVQEPGEAPGVGGTGQGDVDRVPTGGATTAGSIGQDTAAITGSNYQIEAGALEETRGPVAKARHNIRAIELMREIAAEGRTATHEEQEQLARYVGWGALKTVFPDNKGKFGPGGFTDVGKKLRELLNDTDYKIARRTQQYAHYTSELVTRAMWDMAERLGFEGGKVFEPGMGVGNFAGLMPTHISAKTDYQGLEIDPTTTDIARLLYPRFGIRQDDFTKAPLPINTYDMVIGNPPFADITIRSDPKYPQKFLLHDYFFAKSLDAVRPGGILIFVTSAGTMNKLNTKAREYIADQADLVSGIRLPGTAFEKSAGTKVTTDILIFRKRLTHEAEGDRSWIETENVTLPNKFGEDVVGGVNSYFVNNPDQVLGEEGFFDPLFKDRYAVREPVGDPSYNLEAELGGAVERLPQNIMSEWDGITERSEVDFTSTERKDDSFYVGKDGRLMQQRDGVGKPALKRGPGVVGGLTKQDIVLVKGLVPIRDALRSVYEADLNDDTENADLARKRLNKSYDAFVKKHGPINKAEFQYRRPTIVQQETARQQAREDARLTEEFFHEGSFDGTRLASRGESKVNVARARENARLVAASAGVDFDEGTFIPAEMKDVVIDKRPNVRAFMLDPESYRLRAIEYYDDLTGESEKGPVFTENVITREKEPEIRSVNDAVFFVLNKEGRFNLTSVALAAEMGEKNLIAELGDKIFQDPETGGEWVLREEYLSGNVKNKLALARQAAAGDPDFQRNVTALLDVQPIPLGSGEITANLGTPWIPTDIVKDFALNELELKSITVNYHPKAGWNITGDEQSAASTVTWGTADFPAPKIINFALNRGQPKVSRPVTLPDGRTGTELDVDATQAAIDKVTEVKELFKEWVYREDERENRLVDFYNDNFNNLVNQEHDGGYLTTPGVSSAWEWRDHQLRVMARIIQTGNTYMAHAVGSGKTAAMVGAGMEMRRLGLVRKPMYVVPNNMLPQFTKEFYELYPTARIAVADDQRFHTSRRKQFIANVAQEDLDAIILTHSAFEKIPMSADFLGEWIEEQLDELRDILAQFENGDRISRSRIEQQIEALQQRLEAAKSKDAVFTFEEMGVDFLFVDEAHIYRKLDIATTMGGIKGITPKGSGRALDLFVKTRYLQTVNPDRNLVLASGTPLTNTMAELHTLTKFMDPNALADRQLTAFDAWAGAFGQTKVETEQDPAGGYKQVTRFSEFVNAFELSNIVRQTMDVVTGKQLAKLVTMPQIEGGTRTLVLAERSPLLMEYQRALEARMRAIEARGGRAQSGDDIILSVINDGRKAGIDPRLVLAAARAQEEQSKLELLTDNVFDIWEKSKNQPFHSFTEAGYSKEPVRHGPGTQLVFSNLGLHPKASNAFTTPAYLRTELVRRGVPSNEIAFFNNYKTHVQKQRLFNDMNEGKIRILIGSSTKMGLGLNVQTQIVAMHNLDPLWFPAEDEQRVGRGLRQGNMNPFIQIFDYSTKGTYDSTMWQLMATKARFIEGFMRGDPNIRIIEDIGEASHFEQARALTTSDPRLIELTELKQELETNERRSSAFLRQKSFVRSKIRDANDTIKWARKQIKSIDADIAIREDITGDKFHGKVGKKTYTDREKFGEAVIAQGAKILRSVKKKNIQGQVIGSIAGFEITVDTRVLAKRFDVHLKMSGGMERQINDTDSVSVARSIAAILGRLETNRDGFESNIPVQEREIADFTKQLDLKFEGAEEMDRLREAIDVLEKKILGKDEEAEPEPDPEPEKVEPINEGDLDRWLDDGGPVGHPDLLVDDDEAIGPLQEDVEPPYKERPDANAETRAMAKEIMADSRHLANLDQQGAAVKTIATAINADLIKDQKTTLIGKQVNTGEELATLAQVYRNPRWEMLRYFITDAKGRILTQTGLTARLPSTVAPFESGTDVNDWVDSIENIEGAAHVWMVHNHPSGDSRPSKADVNTTRKIANAMSKRGLKLSLDHIVINSNNYSHMQAIIQPNGKAKVQNQPNIQRNFGPDLLLTPAIPHPLLNTAAKTAEQLADIGAAIHKASGWITLIGVDSRGKVRALGEVHEAGLKDTAMLRKELKKFAQTHGTHALYLVGVNPEMMFKGRFMLRRAREWAKKLVSLGLVKDVIGTDTLSLREKDSTVVAPIGVSFDTNIEDETFALREDGEYESDATKQQEEIVKRVRKGQPLDRLLRFMFVKALKLVGIDALNDKGEFKLGVAGINRAKKFLTEAKFTDESPFRFMNGYLEHARMGLIDRYGVPDDFIQLGFESTAAQRKLLRQGLEFLNRLFEAGVSSLEEALLLQKMLTGVQIEDREWTGIALELRQAIDAMGMEAINLGLITRESYERNKGTYLHRVYVKHELGDKNSLSRFMGSMMAGRKHAIKGEAMRGRGIYQEVSQKRLLKDIAKSDREKFELGVKKRKSGKPDESLLTKRFQILDLFDEGESPDNQTLPGIEDSPQPKKLKKRIILPADAEIPASLGNYEHRGVFEVRRIEGNKLVLWRDFTKDERVHMGEILDARYTIAKTYHVLAQDLASARFFSDIAANEEWTWEDGSTPPDEIVAKPSTALRHYVGYEWIKVPTEPIPNTGGKKRWGALAGRYVRAEIWKDLNELDAMNTRGPWQALLKQWKLNKTARHPVVHMNNVISNLTLMDLVDIRARDLYRGIKEYNDKGELYESLREHGGFGHSYIDQEIKNQVLKPVLKDMSKEARAGFYDEGSFLNKLRFVDQYSRMASEGIQRLGKAIGTFDRASREWYTAEDEVFRMAIFIRRLELGDTPIEAAALAREQMLNYDIRAPWVNTARTSVLPFISYTYRAVPVIAEALVRRPWKFAKYALLAEVANALSYAVSDGDEEWERASLRPETKGTVWLGGAPRMIRMPVNDRQGNPIFLDIRRWIPAGDVFDTAPNNPLPIPTWLHFGGPIMIAAEFMLNKQAFTGTQIVDPNIDNLGDKAKKYGEWAWRSFMPSAPWIYDSWYWDKISRSVTGGRDALGRNYSLTTALLSSAGIKAVGHDVELNFAYRRREFDRTERALKYSLRLNAQDLDRNLIGQKEAKRIETDLLDKIERLNENRAETFAPIKARGNN